MQLVSLELIKLHVRADDFTADDDLLQHYADAAVELVVARVRRSPEELAEMGGGKMPLPIVQAVLLIVGHWYNQKEAVSAVQMHEVPLGVQSLLKPYVKLV